MSKDVKSVDDFAPEDVERISDIERADRSASPHRDEIEEEIKKETRCRCILRHFKGCLFILPLLIFHFLCFLVIFSMGIGVGILAATLHQICWDQKFLAFWQTYISLITIFISIEIFFRFGFDTSLTNWMNKLQKRHRVELYYIPRGLYLVGYMGAVGLLYYAYQGAHKEVEDAMKNTNKTKSAFDGEGEADAWKTNPLSLSPSDDQFHYSLIFLIALSYMVYTISKENDWMTHRRTVMEKRLPDPVVRGGVGNFVLYLGAHVIITIIYGLPLVGCVFLARQFHIGAAFAFGFGVFMAVLVGVAALFIERRYPFPTKPMVPPAYAYENHLRIRMFICLLWLLPFAAGRYFDADRSIALDAQNDDLLIFIVEVGAGVISALKIFGNDVFLLKAIFYPPKAPKSVVSDGDEEAHSHSEGDSSIASSMQSVDHNESDATVDMEQEPPVKESNKAPPLASSPKLPPAKESNKAPPIASSAKLPPTKESNKAPPIASSAKLPPANESNKAPSAKLPPTAPPTPPIQEIYKVNDQPQTKDEPIMVVRSASASTQSGDDDDVKPEPSENSNDGTLASQESSSTIMIGPDNSNDSTPNLTMPPSATTTFVRDDWDFYN